MEEQANIRSEKGNGAQESSPPLKQAADNQGSEINASTDLESGQSVSVKKPRRRSRVTRFKHWLCAIKFADAVMAFLTLVIASTGIVGILLVIQGSQDSKRLADAAEKQVSAADRSASAAQRFATTAGEIEGDFSQAVGKLNTQAKQTGKLAGQAIIQANAAKSAAETAKQQFDTSERPWMKVEAGLAPYPNAVSVDPNSSALKVVVLIQGRNVGNSPAMQVRVEAELIPSIGPFTTGEQREVLNKIQQQLCENARAESNVTGLGDAVFPGSPFPITQYLSLPASTLQAELKKPSNGVYTYPKGNIVFFLATITGWTMFLL